MADADTPMTTQREVRQRKRGLYWIIAVLAAVLFGLAIFGLGEDLTGIEGAGAETSAPSSVVVEGEIGG
ncbi:hypothetical protein P5P81_07040 [Tritonibacter mobilis]|nr:hypothetical protein [Tritonibacter mobilis]